MMDRDEARRELQAAGRYLLENGLAWGNAGNLSLRTAPDRCVITAGGTRLGELGDDDFVECGLPAGEPAPGTRRPSKELPMHRAVYLARPQINAVLHASPFYSTLVACSGAAIPARLFVEAMYYLECVERVPYAHPGSEALGHAVGEKVRRANVLLLEHHGVLVVDAGLREALMGLHTLEMACRMIVTAKGAGIELRDLPAATAGDFLERSGYRPRRQWTA